jgi:NAD dependent epimerase/dehydratase family enzyme
VTSPDPVTNDEFTEALAHTLHRPAPFAAPRVVVERVAGDMGRQMLLASQRALPARLKGQGFRFDHPILREALAFMLGRE